jgi:hypothetical protein
MIRIPSATKLPSTKSTLMHQHTNPYGHPQLSKLQCIIVSLSCYQISKCKIPHMHSLRTPTNIRHLSLELIRLDLGNMKKGVFMENFPLQPLLLLPSAGYQTFYIPRTTDGHWVIFP